MHPLHNQANHTTPSTPHANRTCRRLGQRAGEARQRPPHPARAPGSRLLLRPRAVVPRRAMVVLQRRRARRVVLPTRAQRHVEVGLVGLGGSSAAGREGQVLVLHALRAGGRREQVAIGIAA